MLRITVIISVLILILLFSITNVKAENTSAAEEPRDKAVSEEFAGDDEKIHYGCDLDFNSRDVWHGIVSSDGAVFQPSVWASMNNFTFNVWANMEINKGANKGKFNETDLSLSYEGSICNLEVEPGIIFYLYPEGDSTGEFSLKLSYPLGEFSAETIHTFDFINYRGSYFGEIGLGYSKKLNPKLSVDAYAGTGWASSKFNKTYIGVSKSTHNLVNVNLGLTYYPTEHFYIRPHVEASSIIDRTLRANLEKPDFINYGLTVGTEF